MFLLLMAPAVLLGVRWVEEAAPRYDWEMAYCHWHDGHENLNIKNVSFAKIDCINWEAFSTILPDH